LVSSKTTIGSGPISLKRESLVSGKEKAGDLEETATDHDRFAPFGAERESSVSSKEKAGDLEETAG
jgi:hypothetical protein